MIKKYKTKSGETRYMVKAYLGLDPLTKKSKQTSRRGFKTRKEATIAESRLNVRSQDINFVLDSNLLFVQVAEMWLEQYRHTVNPSTFTQQKLARNKHVLPLFGKIVISKITIPYCQTQVNHWFSYYKKFNNLIMIPSQIFQYAINIRLVNYNPMDGVIRPKRQAAIDDEGYKAPSYTQQQLTDFLDLLKNKYPFQWFLMFRVLAYTGLRKGELHALRWNDIDFSRGTLSVKQTLATTEGWQLIFQTPKTRKSIRDISLDDETLRLIKQWKIRQKETFFKLGVNTLDQNQLVFTNENNEVLYLDFLNHRLTKIIKENNLDHMTVHGFRHTHCSLLLEANVPLKEVQERMGHTDIKTTMNVYAHITEKQRENTANKFASFMSN